jgi:hypothetical protein
MTIDAYEHHEIDAQHLNFKHDLPGQILMPLDKKEFNGLEPAMEYAMNSAVNQLGFFNKSVIMFLLRDCKCYFVKEWGPNEHYFRLGDIMQMDGLEWLNAYNKARHKLFPNKYPLLPPFLKLPDKHKNFHMEANQPPSDAFEDLYWEFENF